MNQIDELEASALERSLPDRLRRSAASVAPDPEALAMVRARAAGRRRRSRTGVLVGSAAAVALVAAGVALVGGDDPSTGLTAGPADGGDAAATAPAATEQGDATLVVYRYPNATAEVIAQDPTMGGEWATLLTADRRYHANGPLDELGAESPSEPSGTVGAFHSIDSLRGKEPARIIEVLLAGEFPGAPLPTVAPDQQASVRASSLLLGLLMSGEADATRAAEVRRLLATLPDVRIDESAGAVTVTDQLGGWWVRYDVATGHPLRSGSTSSPISDVEYVSVTRVHAADVLVPGRGTPNSPSTTTTQVGADGGHG